MPAVRSRHTGTVISTRRRRRWCPGGWPLLALGLALGPGAARAQAPGAVYPTRGLHIPGGGLAGDVDATAIEMNPGQLGLIDMASTVLVANAWRKDIAEEGRGLGLMF